MLVVINFHVCEMLENLFNATTTQCNNIINIKKHWSVVSNNNYSQCITHVHKFLHLSFNVIEVQLQKLGRSYVWINISTCIIQPPQINITDDWQQYTLVPMISKPCDWTTRILVGILVDIQECVMHTQTWIVEKI